MEKIKIMGFDFVQTENILTIVQGEKDNNGVLHVLSIQSEKVDNDVNWTLQNQICLTDGGWSSETIIKMLKLIIQDEIKERKLDYKNNYIDANILSTLKSIINKRTGWNV